MVGAAVVLGVMTPLIADHLPQLVHIQHLDIPSIFSQTPLNGLTTWHWAFSSMLVVLAVAAAVGAAREYIRGTLGSWLVIAMVIWAGSQVHNMFWPSPYNPVLTTADVLRLAFAIIVAVGGVVELRRVATERATLLAAQRELTNRLTELAIMKADFTAMVVHELHSPLAASVRSRRCFRRVNSVPSTIRRQRKPSAPRPTYSTHSYWTSSPSRASNETTLRLRHVQFPWMGC